MHVLNLVNHSDNQLTMGLLESVNGKLFLKNKSILTIILKKGCTDGMTLEAGLDMYRLQRNGNWARINKEDCVKGNLCFMLPPQLFGKSREFEVGQEVTYAAFYDSGNSNDNLGDYPEDWDGDLTTYPLSVTSDYNGGEQICIYKSTSTVIRKLKNGMYLLHNKHGYIPVPGALICIPLNLVPFLN